MKRLATLTLGWSLPVALAVLGAALPALAQDSAAAETLFNKGVSEMQAGHYDVACPALAESQKLDPRAGTLFTLAECESKAGKIATALVHYEDYVRLAELLPAAQKQRHLQRMQIANAQRAALKGQVPTLTLTLPKGAPATLRVSRDGTELASASMGVALPVDPGEHVVMTSIGDGPRTEQRITLAKGDKKVAELRWAAGPAASATAAGSSTAPIGPGPGADTGTSGRRIGAYIAGGIGVAGLALGGVTGGLALSSKSEVDAHCANLVCDAQGSKALDQGRTMGLVSTVGFAVGAAGVVTAVVLWLTEPSPKAASPTPRVGVLKQAVSSVGVSAGIGPSGAAIELKGAF